MGNNNIIIDDNNNNNNLGREIRVSTAGLYCRGNSNNTDELEIKLKSSLAKVDALEISIKTGMLDKKLAESLNLAFKNDNNVDEMNNNNSNNNNNIRYNSMSPTKHALQDKKVLL
jgi:hypothetical protein